MIESKDKRSKERFEEGAFRVDRDLQISIGDKRPLDPLDEGGRIAPNFRCDLRCGTFNKRFSRSSCLVVLTKIIFKGINHDFSNNWMLIVTLDYGRVGTPGIVINLFYYSNKVSLYFQWKEQYFIHAISLLFCNLLFPRLQQSIHYTNCTRMVKKRTRF